MMTFEQFFKTATEHAPYDYQQRLAGGDAGRSCASQLINIPTGLGKTAAVILAWLWNRVQIRNPEWPRRLVYCLPMRTLVEQTEVEVKKWLAAHELVWDGKPENRRGKIGVHVLMGGEDAGEWDIYPEESAILIGTQDMLLSRALNRGYGMNRYRWPMHFGLLNNDCLWVMDETQLMGVGVETSAQLDGFRYLSLWTQNGNCPTWWMSATLNEARFATVDHPKPVKGWEKVSVSDTERAADGVRERFEAKKPITPAEFALSPTTKDDHAGELAKLIAKKHVPGTLTLIVVNRVSRARNLYSALLDKKLGLDPSHMALIHSRFRPVDRERHTKLLFDEGDRIVVATQAVEAGVDVSARLLITELAPWSSLVQRFGRCNRQGKIPDAEAIWIDIQPKDDNDDLLLPYSADDLKKAREAITGRSDVGPQSLGSIHVPETPVVRPVLRRRDLIDLFDTTPDLCGQDLDISRYIRDGEDSDVQFFWRNIPEKSAPTPDEKPPCREELCRVSIGDAKKFIAKKPTRAWQWNSLEEVWLEAGHARPGAVYLIDVASGGYDDDLGWTGESKSRPTTHPPADGDAEAYRKDPQTFARHWLSLDKHAQDVVTAMASLAENLSLDPAMTATVRTAALWHDVGKAHESFQEMLGGDRATLWAKSANKGETCSRRDFRHELASALAWLSAGPPDAPERNLVAYLIAAHHGKVRLSIRALPDEKGNPNNPDALFARGIWDQDKLPAIPGLTKQPVTLDLSLMRMGEGEQGPSWLARTIALRDNLGPFRLAFLESILRAADIRACDSDSGGGVRMRSGNLAERHFFPNG